MWISHDDPKKWNDSSVLRSWWCILWFFLTPLQKQTKTNLDASSVVLSVKTHLRALHLPGVSLEPSFTEETEEHGLSWKLVGLFFFEVRNLLDDGGCWTSTSFNPKRICQIVKWSFLCPSYRPRTLKGGSWWIYWWWGLHCFNACRAGSFGPHCLAVNTWMDVDSFHDHSSILDVTHHECQ